MPDETILRAYDPSDRDWMVARHAALYAASDGFDDSFGPLVGKILDAFAADHDPAFERGWIAQQGTQRLGSIFCVRHDAARAKLRLFLLDPAARGQGLGQRLLATCMGFAKDAGFTGMTLWTHESHRAACALYQKAGWSCIRSEPVHSFGVDLVEQTWVIDFDAAN